MYDAYMHPCIYVLGLCNNGKSDISISAIIFYRFISIDDIILIMLSAKNLVLSVSSSNLNRPVACKGSRMQLFLIAVTSRLDAVVACINVLHPMENQ